MPRYSETWLFPENVGPAYFEPLIFIPGQSSMVLLPKPATRWVPWLEQSEKFDVLIELGEMGRIAGHPIEHMTSNFDPLVSELRSEMESAESLSVARTKMIAIGERFIRGRIDIGRNLYLSTRILYHLNLMPNERGQIMFVAVAGTFEIWTMDFYKSIRDKLAASISDHCTHMEF